MHSQTLVYLASPYSVGGANRETRHARYLAACRTAARLMKSGDVVFSPIAHSHSIEVDGEFGEVEGHDFWLRQDFGILRHCSIMKVLHLPGADNAKSVGITAERAVAAACGIPVIEIDEEGKQIVQ